MTDHKTPDSIFCAAVEIDCVSERAIYLDQACGDDYQLRARVEQLLQAHGMASRFMVSDDETLDPISITEDTMIDAYKLREKLGEGGMGVVWAAEQVQPVRRKVALKVIKPGMDTKAVVARFEAERQALALMDHPNIAHVLDAGTTQHGWPYFVMELIRGIPITKYCDTNKLTIPERLRLFTQVCGAVQHAHQKGIIHRDVKPSNVLVTLHDSVPVPKVIDFGIAKALNQKLTEKTIYTRVHQAIGTLAYMSPEQAELSGLDIDTRADVYGLGVLLYELLTGTTPFEQQRLHDAAYHEACRIIRDEDPPRPSIRLSTLGDTATAVAANRSSDIARLGAVFRGELDWIVMKALEKDRTRRYESAADLANDVARHLDNEPVTACPPSAGYRFKKFASKNRIWLTTVGMVCISLAVGTAIATWQAVQTRTKAKQLAENINELERTKTDLASNISKLREVGREREAALKKWQQELFMRALTAAFAEDSKKVNELIEEAKSIGGGPPQWEGKIRGQLSLFSGDVDEALSILKECVDKDPSDVGAVALLSLAYLDSGNHIKYLEHRNRLAELKSQTPLEELSAEDKLLAAEAEMFGDILEGVDTIKSVIVESPSPLALAFLCEAHLKLHYGSGEPESREAALAELYAVKQLMPDSAYVARLDFWLNFMLLTQGDESTERMNKVKEAFEKLGTFPLYPSAHHARACYFDRVLDEPKRARSEWEAVVDSQAGGWIHVYYAAFEYRRGNHSRAMDILRNSSEHAIWAQIYLAEAAALEGRDAEARERYGEIFDEISELSLRSDDFVGIPETILLLLGEQSRASEKVAERLRISADSLPWPKVMLDFVADPDMEVTELLAGIPQGTGHNYNLVVAYKLAAFRHLGLGELNLAEEFLEKCRDACSFQPDAYWADAFLCRLRTDGPLREKLARK